MLSLRASDRCHWCDNPSPAPVGAAVLFTFASGGHLSFNSERKVRKNATKTYGFGFPWRAAPCRKLALCFSRNQFFRVPLSVKRTVPPQLSATASLPLPVATVGVSPSTAVTGYSLSQRSRPRYSCHCEPVTDVTGVAIRPPVPAPAGAAPLFIFASGGHLSFNSERKVRKNATKTYGFGFPQRATPCREFVSFFLAQSVFPCAAVGQKDCATTAFRYRFAAAAYCHGSSFPLYRRTGARPISTQPSSLAPSFRASPQAGVGIRPSKAPSGGFRYCCGATRRTYLLQCFAPQKARFDNRHTTGREFPKGEGAHALSLWTLQGEGIFKGRGKSGIPLPLNGVFGYFCRCWQK